jgi:hypothetical protein
VLPEQVLPPVQTFPHPPQLLELVVVSTQLPLQSVSVPGHLHVPPEQVCPAVHATALAQVVPHFVASVDRL